MNNYMIGIDGGGTKTLGVLFDNDGLEIARVIESYANFSVDETKTKQHIEQCIEGLLKHLPREGTLNHIQLGIAGISAFAEQEAYTTALTDRFQASVDLVSDAVIALYSVKRDSDQAVIMIVSGTGSIIMANEADETHVIGGYGHLLGEEGSGYHLAIQTLKAMIEEGENSQPNSSLSLDIMQHLSITKREDLIHFVYHGKKSDIAKLSRFIAQCAESGNENAKNLFEEEGKHLARQTINAYRKLKTTKPPMIALRGKFLMQAPFVKSTLLAILKEKIGEFSIDDAPVEPVLGAYYLSKIKLVKR